MTGSLRVGVIGVGEFGERHLAAYALQPEVEVVAVADSDAERARAVAERWGVARWFSAGGELLDCCAPDGVSIVTPGPFHLAPALAALARDTAVLLEKPIAMTGAEARLLVAAAEASAAFVVPAHVLRFSEPYVGLRERVRAGDLGRLLGISARRERGTDHERMFPGVHPALMTMVHDIDLAVWMSGSRAVRVSALGRRAPDPHEAWPSSGAEPPPRLLWATVEAQDGSVWSLRVSWLLPDGEALSDRFEVFGAAGVDVAESFGAPAALGAGIEAEVAHFCACMRDGRCSDVVGLDEAAHGIAVAEAVIASSRAGGAVVEVGA
jgi:predicted dehydrogenase